MPGLLLVSLATLWLLAAFNKSFWQQTYVLFGDRPGLLVLFVLGIWSFTMVYVLVFSNRWFVKPFLIANIFIAAGASYYHESMGIIIDREMVQNILGTTANESKNLLTVAYIRYMLIFAVLPSLVILAVRVWHPPFLKSAMHHIALLGLCVLMFVGVTLPNYQVFSFGVRQSPGMRSILHPVSTVQSIAQYAEMKWRAHALEFQEIATDAHKGATAQGARRPILTVLVVGETLRDQNWGLSGYERDTTPELAKRDILAIGGVESCGTSTVVSVPCMFSKLTHEEFSQELAAAQENLLDVLVRAGYDVEWLDVNTGDMGVADRVNYENFNKAEDPEYCRHGECNDGILLKRLRARARAITRDTVIVLHQLGNHGPAYFERYPQDFARFLPDCREADPANCATGDVVNAYDNAVAFTDLQLSRTIDYLSGLSDLSTSLVFVSDHGESLGEKGLFLHAAPYWLAPKEQTRVPMVVWMSDRFQQDLKLAYDCVAPSDNGAVSHDNLFHSVLGMLNVETVEYDQALDIFAPCRRTEKVATK